MKKFLIIITILSCRISSYGQIYVKNSEQSFIEKVVSKCIVLLKSDYVIEDKITNQQFGLNGNKTFNSVYSLGYLTKKGIVTDTDMQNLVSKDVKFDKYKEGYNPIITSSVWCFYKDSTYNELILDSTSTVKNEKIIIYCSKKKDTLNEGFTLDANDESGWIIWVCIDDNTELSISSELFFYSYHFTNKTGESESITCPQTNMKVLGGILISPNYSTIGNVSFSLNGILRCVDKNWILEFIICNSNQNNCTNEDAHSELTPISSAPNGKEQNSKKKKSKKKL